MGTRTEVRGNKSLGQPQNEPQASADDHGDAGDRKRLEGEDFALFVLISLLLAASRHGSPRVVAVYWREVSRVKMQRSVCVPART